MADISDEILFAIVLADTGDPDLHTPIFTARTYRVAHQGERHCGVGFDDGIVTDWGPESGDWGKKRI